MVYFYCNEVNKRSLFIYLFSEVRPLWNWFTLGKCLSVVQVPMRQWITLPNSLGCCFFLADSESGKRCKTIRVWEKPFWPNKNKNAGRSPNSCPMPNTFDTFQTPNGNPWLQTRKIEFNGCFGMRWVGGGGGEKRCIFATSHLTKTSSGE